jgi:DNA-binding Lrp family transcriptional regulator
LIKFWHIPPVKIDLIDHMILSELQQDGRLNNVELARRVGLSPSPCLRRVRLLEEAGVIRGYVALLDGPKIGLTLTVFARIWLTGQDEETTSHFIQEIQKLPQVVECHVMAGDCDFILRVVVADLEAYRRFQIDHLGRIRNVRNIKTEIPMQTVKAATQLPLAVQ